MSDDFGGAGAFFLHGETMVNSYGQKPMENSWISLMKFSWDISIRGAP